MKAKFKVEILIISEWTYETEVIDAIDFDNAKIITDHLNKEFKIRITTQSGEMVFSGMNAWSEISEFFEPVKKAGFLGYVD